MAAEIITAKSLNLWYGTDGKTSASDRGHHALKDINVNIPARQITALIGPSGCGKSTFLKTLNRMNDLVPGVHIEGEVCFDGQNIFDKTVDTTWLRKQVGMVFQKANPFPCPFMTTWPTVPGPMASETTANWMALWKNPCGTRPFGMR